MQGVPSGGREGQGARGRPTDAEGQPLVLRWGKAVAHVLSHTPIHIEEDELIVGSAGPPGRYAVLYPELEERFFSEAVRPSQPDDRIVGISRLERRPRSIPIPAMAR